MAQSWEWNPEASAMDTGFRLDELLRTQRAENARQAQQLGANAQNLQQQHQNRLGEMLYGQTLKDQSAQTEAERTAPFLQQLIRGNPQVGKAFGFVGEPQIERTGAMAEPEAMGTPAPIVQRPVAPTLQQTTGLARAIPGIAQALLQKGLEPSSAGFTLKPGERRFDAQGHEIAEGGALPGMDLQTAQNVRDQMMRENPALRGRVTLQSDASGRWSVRETPSEPLTENPNLWLSKAMDPNAPVGERIQAKMKYDQWLTDQATLAGSKAFQTNVNTPYDATTRDRMDKTNMAIQSAYRLLSYTPKERENFTGAGKLGYEGARLAQEVGLPTPGYSKDDVARYSQFVKDNGFIEQYKFAIGGKQLTGPEQKVVEAFIPTGREFTTSEYEAKVRGMVAVMEASQVVDQYLAVTPKNAVNPIQIREMFKSELAKRGIDVTKSKDAQVESQMNSGSRLRKKYGEPQ